RRSEHEADDNCKGGTDGPTVGGTTPVRVAPDAPVVGEPEDSTSRPSLLNAQMYGSCRGHHQTENLDAGTSLRGGVVLHPVAFCEPRCRPPVPRRDGDQHRG